MKTSYLSSQSLPTSSSASASMASQSHLGLRRHYKRRRTGAVRDGNTFSDLARAESLLTLLAEDYLSVHEATILSMASYSISDTIQRCARRHTLDFRLRPTTSTENAGLEYALVVARILSASKTFASVLHLVISGGCSSCAHFDLTSLDDIKQWCMNDADSMARQTFMSETNVAFARRFFTSLRSIVVRDVRVGFDDATLGLLLKLADPEVSSAVSGKGQSSSAAASAAAADDAVTTAVDGSHSRVGLREIILEHCPSVHLGSLLCGAGQGGHKILQCHFPSSLQRLTLDGCGVSSLSTIKDLVVDQCPGLIHLSLLRTPAFVKWLNSGLLHFHLQPWHVLERFQSSLREGWMLKQMMETYSLALSRLHWLLLVMENAQREMYGLLEHIHAHLASFSSPPRVAEHRSVLENEVKSNADLKRWTEDGICVLRKCYCAICKSVLDSLPGVFPACEPESLSVIAFIDEGEFIDYLDRTGFLLAVWGARSKDCHAYSHWASDNAHNLASYFNNRRMHFWSHESASAPVLLEDDIVKNLVPVPENSVRLNRMILDRLCQNSSLHSDLSLSSSPLSSSAAAAPASAPTSVLSSVSVPYSDFSVAATTALTHMAVAAQGGGGVVPEFQLLLSTAAVLDSCSPDTLGGLLRSGGSGPNDRWGDANWFTPLMGAAQAGNPAKVALLLQHGCDPRRECHNGSTAMHFAIASTSPWAARTIRVIARALGSDYVATYRERETGFTLLHRAALEAETLSVFKAVIGLPGTASIVDVRSHRYGHTALQFACVESSDAPVRVRLLLAAGASVNLRDNIYGDTALMFACRHYERLNRSAMVLRVLLDYGADRDLRSHENDGRQGETALGYLQDVHQRSRPPEVATEGSGASPEFLAAVRRSATRLLVEYESPAMAAARRRMGASPRRRRSRRGPR